MKTLLSLAAVLAAGVLLGGVDARADKGVELKSTAKLGKKLIAEAFDEPQLGKAWAVEKGDWNIEEGAVAGRENPANKQAAMLTLEQPTRDSVLRFSFKFDGATGFNLSFNHAKGELFRIAVDNQAHGYSVDAYSKPRVMTFPGGSALTPGEWHTMLVTIRGEKISAQTDDGGFTTFNVPSLDVDKTGIGFATRGESLSIDDVTVWRIER